MASRATRTASGPGRSTMAARSSGAASGGISNAVRAASVVARADPCVLTINGRMMRRAGAAVSTGASASSVHEAASRLPRPSAWHSATNASSVRISKANPAGNANTPSTPTPASAPAGIVARSPVNLNPMLASLSSSLCASAASPEVSNIVDTSAGVSKRARQPPTSILAAAPAPASRRPTGC